MSQPLVSILLPAYNAENFITEAITSITDQTYSNLEIIVIDDGSTDATENKIKLIKDKRVKLIKNETNKNHILFSKQLNKELNKDKSCPLSSQRFQRLFLR